jgi:ubiquinone/menaquinone biosynthesis C-methylase UbiE
LDLFANARFSRAFCIFAAFTLASLENREGAMTSWYERKVLPQIIRLACGCAALTENRQAIVSQARGRVLELGLGAGANLPFYDAGAVAEVVGVEPSPELRDIAAKAPRADGLKLDLREGAAESLPFGPASFDAVVCTFTLCTVADAGQALSEARRVLRPGGAFLFCEHGLSPDPGVARWQHRIEPVWKRLFGGCHLTRDVSAGVSERFRIEQIEKAYQPKGPKFAGWMEMGRAVAA